MKEAIKQRYKKYVTDNRAVSPVIGVILMVAITTILAAVIGFFVLGIGNDQQSAPQASFTFDTSPNPTAGKDVTITHDGGDTLDASQVSIVASSGTVTQFTGTVSAGSSTTVTGASSGATIRVTYTMDNGQTTTLASYTVP